MSNKFRKNTEYKSIKFKYRKNKEYKPFEYIWKKNNDIFDVNKKLETIIQRFDRL